MIDEQSYALTPEEGSVQRMGLDGVNDVISGATKVASMFKKDNSSKHINAYAKSANDLTLQVQNGNITLDKAREINIKLRGQYLGMGLDYKDVMAVSDSFTGNSTSKSLFEQGNTQDRADQEQLDAINKRDGTNYTLNTPNRGAILRSNRDLISAQQTFALEVDKNNFARGQLGLTREQVAFGDDQAKKGALTAASKASRSMMNLALEEWNIVLEESAGKPSPKQIFEFTKKRTTEYKNLQAEAIANGGGLIKQEDLDAVSGGFYFAMETITNNDADMVKILSSNKDLFAHLSAIDMREGDSKRAMEVLMGLGVNIGDSVFANPLTATIVYENIKSMLDSVDSSIDNNTTTKANKVTNLGDGNGVKATLDAYKSISKASGGTTPEQLEALKKEFYKSADGWIRGLNGADNISAKEWNDLARLVADKEFMKGYLDSGLTSPDKLVGIRKPADAYFTGPVMNSLNKQMSAIDTGSRVIMAGEDKAVVTAEAMKDAKDLVYLEYDPETGKIVAKATEGGIPKRLDKPNRADYKTNKEYYNAVFNTRGSNIQAAVVAERRKMLNERVIPDIETYTSLVAMSEGGSDNYYINNELLVGLQQTLGINFRIKGQKDVSNE